MKVVNESKTLKNEVKTFLVKPVIDQLMRVILYSSTKKGIFLINDVCPDVKTKNDLNILALVLGNLLKDAISFSEDDCIRISSNDNGEIVVSSKKNYLARNSSFIVGVDSLQIIAQRLGTPVSISGSFANGTEILVSFNKNAA